MDLALLQPVFWAALVLGAFVSLLRRAMVHASPSRLSDYFERYESDDSFDESEKLHRVDVVLGGANLIFRAAWAAAFVLWRERTGAWYATSPAGDAAIRCRRHRVRPAIAHCPDQSRENA